MMDTDILDMLEDIGRLSVARLNPTVTLAAETTEIRREKILRTIRGTILPRRLEFTAANGDCLAMEVNSSRVTDVFRVRSGMIPDFETTPREELATRLAELVSDIAAAPAPLELLSLQPDTALEVDDVGVTFSEIAKACGTIELPPETVVSLVPDTPAPQETDIPASAAGATAGTIASAFFDGAERFALGRAEVALDGAAISRLEGVCDVGQPMHADQDLLRQFAQDLVGWDGDAATALDHPQLIVMRPSGGKGDALAVLHDGSQFALAIHEARKLGAVVNLWKSVTGSEK